MNLRVGICITTHNRRDDLARTLAALARLDPAPDEILIAADGCVDGTPEWLATAHPEARLIVHEIARGSIPSRNALATASNSDIFVSLDDDSYPLDTRFISEVRGLFEDNPTLAVASFPQRSDEFPDTLTAPDFGPPLFVGSFANSGAAIRRTAFLALGSYPDFFFHAYEEPDFALRCVAAGWQVRQVPSLLVRHHFTAAQRNERRTHQRHARNELWSVLMRCPLPQLFAVAAFRIIRQFGYAVSRGASWVWQEPAWWFAAARGVRKCLAVRAPIPWRQYVAWMRLQRRPLTSEAEWLREFGGRAT
ncbi:MAG TPA: glycosyltransferase [Chthoniobacteraceae bacterium]|jgi:GT2 family glycosyltransferase|nr:hypothetical protein [Chthoniobacter sp.]HEV7866748.1 glycosyltransferase [Chthoniobacteraceae bacterium]